MATFYFRFVVAFSVFTKETPCTCCIILIYAFQVDEGNDRCQVLFEDKSTFYVLFKDTHRGLNMMFLKHFCCDKISLKSTSKEVSWCCTPSQPVRLYQGDEKYKLDQKVL